MSTTYRRRTLAVATAAATVALGATALGAGATASAAPGDEPASTPVPIATPDGQLSAYVVNAEHAGNGPTKQVAKAVEAADGVVVQSWPQIGVVVAHSTNGDFRADVVSGRLGRAVDSVGATRTVAVTEGTPDTVAGASARSGATQRQQARELKATSQFARVEATQTAVPDPDEAAQWDMRQIKADQAHDVTDGSRKVVVGILDSGIDAAHPDLAPNVDAADSVNCTDAGRPDTDPAGWAPTTSSHGTHVAGTVAAARNGVGIVGVAPGVRLASVKVVNDAGFIYPEYAVCGFIWAGAHGMDVTNNSYYVDPFMYYCEDQPDQYAAKEAVRRAVTWSTKQGVVHAAAAGNASTDLSNNTTDTTSPDDSTAVERTINSGCHDIPTELEGVATVSSTDEATLLSSFSNRGLGVVDVAAPGSRILSTVPGGGYGLMSGTSMASPHVAGVLALLKSAHPHWKPAQLLGALRAQAADHACSVTTAGPACVGPEDENSYYGEGIADALAAVS